MKVLLIPVPCGKNMLPLVPVGVIYIADSLRRRGLECEIFDLNFHSDAAARLHEKLRRYRPDIVGLSIRNIAESPPMNSIYDRIADIAAVCRRYAPIVLGGAGFSLFPHELMRRTGAEYGVVGAGEEAMAYLLENLKKIPLHTVLSRPYEGFPYSDISAEASRYWKTYGKFFAVNASPIPIQTVRGCRFGCAYCSYPLLNGISWRPVRAVVEEMKSIYQGTHHNRFHFVDSVFNMDLRYTHQLLDALLDSRLHLKWSCGINPHAWDGRLFEKMKKAGCVFCEIGADSFCDRVLQSLHKPFTSQMAKEMIMAVQRQGIPYGLSLILGGDGETVETLYETVEYALTLAPDRVFAFIGERIYPGTPLAKQFSGSPCELLIAGEDSFAFGSGVREAIEDLRKKAPSNWSFTGFVT